MITKTIYFLLIILNSAVPFSMTINNPSHNYLNNLYIKRSSFSTFKYDKNPSVNYLKFLNNIQKPPIYSESNPIKKTTYDDIFLNLCDHNIAEFIVDDDITKMIVKYNSGICKIIYNNNENIINKIIDLHFMIGDNIDIKIIKKNDKYYCEE
jgi:hypothetical protein